ncbi:MAG: hypothetical protein DDG58_13600 [Ardenticatenia bacterium]|nr:MAG: hypothetical protein DDG58_13600 [Ardenticatenia bacterium]
MAEAHDPIDEDAAPTCHSDVKSRDTRFTWNLNHLIIMLTAGVAVFATIVAALQTDANIRASQANREAQAQALRTLQSNVSDLFEVGYDLQVVRLWWSQQRLALSAKLLASTEEDPDRSAWYLQELQRLASTSKLLTDQSNLFTSPYFDVVTGLWPDLNRYWYEQVVAPQMLASEHQSVQMELGRAWGQKGNAYQTIITLVAVTLFLYGLALTVERYLKWGFLALGSANLSFILVWTVLTAIQPIPHVAPQALEAYVAGHIKAIYALQEEIQSQHGVAPEKADEAIAYLSRAIALRPDYTAAYVTRGDAYTVKGEALLFGEGDATVRDASFRQAVADYRRALELQPDSYHTYWNLGWALYLLGEPEPALEAVQRVIELSPVKQFGARLVLGEILMGMGNPQEGLAEIRRAIEHAAAHPLSSDAYYFRQMIRNSERLQVVRPHPGLPESTLLLKEAFVSLQYRGKPYPGSTRAQITHLAFGVPMVERAGKVTQYWISDHFPANTEQVNVLFDYQDMVEGEQVVLKVYYNGVERPFYHQILTWHNGASGRCDYLAVRTPVQHTPFGLLPGRYRVEIYVEGNLRASGEFIVES